MSTRNKKMYLEDDFVDATIIPQILLVEVGMALHLEHARLVLVPTVPNNKQILEEKHWKKNTTGLYLFPLFQKLKTFQRKIFFLSQEPKRKLNAEKQVE